MMKFGIAFCVRSIFYCSLAAQDLDLPLEQSTSIEANKLKHLTSPLSKLAKGMQNIGLNLDPRKIGTKVSWLKFVESKNILIMCFVFFIDRSTVADGYIG